MAVSQASEERTYTLPTLTTRDLHWTDSDMQDTYSAWKWIDEELYRTTILQLYPATTEKEADENLQRDALDLGLSPTDTSTPATAVTSSPSAATIDSDVHQGSIISQSTAPTSCDSSERRPSTSLSNRSSRRISSFEMPLATVDMERKRHHGLRDGLRKMTTFRKKKPSSSSTPSMTSIRSAMTGTTTNDSINSRSQAPLSVTSADSHSSHGLAVTRESRVTDTSAAEQALQRSMECEELVRLRAQQMDEKRRFLEYQTRLVLQLLAKREEDKVRRGKSYQTRIVEQEDKNEKAVEELEARQLEEEMKQMKEHETEKKAIQTRLKHMEAYCQTPSPPTSPIQPSHHRGSVGSDMTIPERHVTQYHYENLAQAYHMRDNMDALHASKINVLRGKQKRALQNFMLKREREIEQIERERQKELDSVDTEYGKQEAEIRHEFDLKRSKLEARWKLQMLIEKTRMERSTGLKYEFLPDLVTVDT